MVTVQIKTLINVPSDISLDELVDKINPAITDILKHFEKIDNDIILQIDEFVKLNNQESL